MASAARNAARMDAKMSSITNQLDDGLYDGVVPSAEERTIAETLWTYLSSVCKDLEFPHILIDSHSNNGNGKFISLLWSNLDDNHLSVSLSENNDIVRWMYTDSSLRNITSGDTILPCITVDLISKLRLFTSLNVAVRKKNLRTPSSRLTRPITVTSVVMSWISKIFK